MKRILVAIDSTARAPLVIERAIEIAQATHAKIRLIRVVPLTPPFVPLPGVWTPASADCIDSLIAAAESSLARVQQAIPVELRDGVVVEVGSASHAICRAAQTYDVDLIVIGAHRYGAMARVLSTTAGGVVNQADRPVLVVRAPQANQSAPAL